jgi:hypothetical protein
MGVSVIVDYFNMSGISVFPGKTDAPLAVNANAVLTLSVSFQGFQPIRGRNPQVFNGGASMQHFELSECNLLNIIRQSF